MEGNTEPLKLFVGGLSWDTTNDSLRIYFSQFGDVTDAIVMIDSGTRKPRGFGFVTFGDKKSMDKALEEKDHTLDSKKIDPKPATKKNSMASTRDGTRDGTRDSMVTKIFIGGLSVETTEEQVSVYFSQYGLVKGVDLKRDKETSRMRGFGFVDFEDPLAVQNVLKTGLFHMINGKRVEVKKAEPRKSRADQPDSRKDLLYGASAPAPFQQYPNYGAYQQQQPPYDYYSNQSYGSYSNYGPPAGDQSYVPSGHNSQQQSSQAPYSSYQPSHSTQGYNPAATADSSYSTNSSYPSSGTYNYPEEGSAYNSRTTSYASHNPHGY